VTSVCIRAYVYSSVFVVVFTTHMGLYDPMGPEYALMRVSRGHQYRSTNIDHHIDLVSHIDPLRK